MRKADMLRSRAVSAPSCACIWLRLYTTASTSRVPSPQNWRLQGIPPPRPVAKVDLSEVLEEDTRPVHGRKPTKRPTPECYKSYRAAIKKAFPEGWAPPRKLSREAMDGLRDLHRFDPERFTTPVLADKFRISPEAVRRILKSKWEPTREVRIKLAEKERRRREELKSANRLEEMKKIVTHRLAMEKGLEMLNRMSAERPRMTAPSVQDDPVVERHQTKGLHSKDKFFFG